MTGPTKVYIALPGGERVDCLIEKTGDLEWQATPVRDLSIADLEESAMFVDLLPPGGSVNLHLQGEDVEMQPTDEMLREEERASELAIVRAELAHLESLCDDWIADRIEDGFTIQEISAKLRAVIERRFPERRREI